MRYNLSHSRPPKHHIKCPHSRQRLFLNPASANWTQSRAPTERPTRSSAKSRIQQAVVCFSYACGAVNLPHSLGGLGVTLQPCRPLRRQSYAPTRNVSSRPFDGPIQPKAMADTPRNARAFKTASAITEAFSICQPSTTYCEQCAPSNTLASANRRFNDSALSSIIPCCNAVGMKRIFLTTSCKKRDRVDKLVLRFACKDDQFEGSEETT